ncbi:MAG: hypothetical protein ACI81O_001785 [Cyclobacteriaceae bacterium]|jgi:hypothetical protein
MGHLYCSTTVISQREIELIALLLDLVVMALRFTLRAPKRALKEETRVCNRSSQLPASAQPVSEDVQ